MTLRHLKTTVGLRVEFKRDMRAFIAEEARARGPFPNERKVETCSGLAGDLDGLWVVRRITTAWMSDDLPAVLKEALSLSLTTKLFNRFMFFAASVWKGQVILQIFLEQVNTQD